MQKTSWCFNPLSSRSASNEFNPLPAVSGPPLSPSAIGTVARAAIFSERSQTNFETDLFYTLTDSGSRVFFKYIHNKANHELLSIWTPIKSWVNGSPVATRGFGGLIPPKQSSKPLQIEIWNTINQWSFRQFLECQAPVHKREVPQLRLSGDGSGERINKSQQAYGTDSINQGPNNFGGCTWLQLLVALSSGADKMVVTCCCT